MLHVDVDHHGISLLYIDHHEVMYGRWIYYHIMEININAQFQPTCCAENDHFVNHKSFAHHSFSKKKNDHQVATGGKHGVLSCPQAAGRNAASTMLLHALGCYGVSMLVLAQPMVPTKTIFHTFASFLRTPFHPLQTLNPKKLPKK